VPSRLGIELSSTSCRVVEVQTGRRLGRDDADTCLTAFAMMPRHDAEVSARLNTLAGRRATVVVWAPGVDHRSVVVADGPYRDMKAEARAAVRAAGRGEGEALTDIAPIPINHTRRYADLNRRIVLLASAPMDQIAQVLSPLVAAGIRIDHVLTPAAALVSLARRRRSFARPGAFELYVALDETAGAVALIRDGVLLAAVDLAWGFVDEVDGQRAPRRREDVTALLAEDIAAFLFEGGLSCERIQHICVASGAPDLRSMSMMLMERLDIEVEPLDSLFGIDRARLPESEEDCRAFVPTFRLAWAAAVDERPPLDLFRPQRWAARQSSLSRAAIAAGVVMGLGLGWSIQDRMGAPIGPAARSALVNRAMPVLAASALPIMSVPVTLPHADRQVASEPPRPVFRPMREPAFAPPAPRGSEPDAAPVAPRDNPPASPAQVATTSSESPRASPPAVAVSRPRRSAPPATKPGERPEPIEPAPFDATLESILYAPDRRLAIVDGRIIGIGDFVHRARVVDITQTAVTLEDSRGRLVQLTAGRNAR
jgi:hypothetical protein